MKTAAWLALASMVVVVFIFILTSLPGTLLLLILPPPPGIRFCSKCGQPNPPAAASCQECGQAFFLRSRGFLKFKDQFKNDNRLQK